VTDFPLTLPICQLIRGHDIGVKEKLTGPAAPGIESAEARWAEGPTSNPALSAHEKDFPLPMHRQSNDYHTATPFAISDTFGLVQVAPHAGLITIDVQGPVLFDRCDTVHRSRVRAPLGSGTACQQARRPPQDRGYRVADWRRRTVTPRPTRPVPISESVKGSDTGVGATAKSVWRRRIEVAVQLSLVPLAAGRQRPDAVGEAAGAADHEVKVGDDNAGQINSSRERGR
jgi:hypothetical protein